MLSNLSAERRGALYGVTAYLMWGFAALFWVQTSPVSATDLLSHRALWAVPFLWLCLFFSRRLGTALAVFRKPKVLATMALAALFGATNWLIFLWAISNGKATEASLGYFLLPLINVMLGVTLFKERISGIQKVGVAFAVAAVLVQIVGYGGLPMIALGLSLSFGLYGVIRKKVSIESMEGLFVETLIMAPFALSWILYHGGAGLGEYGFKVNFFLIAAGAFTAVPLLAYVAASRLLPLSALGLLFYIGPSAQLLVAVAVFDEPLDTIKIVSFALVWAGLCFVTFANIRELRKLRRLRA